MTDHTHGGGDDHQPEALPSGLTVEQRAQGLQSGPPGDAQDACQLAELFSQAVQVSETLYQQREEAQQAADEHYWFRERAEAQLADLRRHMAVIANAEGPFVISCEETAPTGSLQAAYNENDDTITYQFLPAESGNDSEE